MNSHDNPPNLRAVESGEPSQVPGGTNGGGSGGIEARLRGLEIQMARIEVRVDNIEANMATKTDISNLKVWILGGVLSGIVLAVTIATIVVKAFFTT